MNYRNNPGTGNQHYDWHGRERLAAEQLSKSSGAKSTGFSFAADLPTMPPATVTPPTQDILPAVIPESTAELIETTATSKAGGFSLSNLPNLTEIKGFVDRIGGIDGILTTVTKVQKVMSSVSQMAPLVKVLMGSFKKPDKSDDDEVEWKPKRRKRRKPASGTGAGNGARRRKPKRR